LGLALSPVHEAKLDFVAANAMMQSTTPPAAVDKTPQVQVDEQKQTQEIMKAFHEKVSPVSVRSQSLDGLKPGSKHAELVNELRSSVVRIEKIETVVNWFEPYGDTKKSASVGTGFAAKLVNEDTQEEIPPNTDEDPIFITNAHVARNAESLRLQLSAIGQRSFTAHVPVIYDIHDLAIVKLDQPKEFMAYLEANKVKLRVLRVRKHEAALGLSVIAIGFPLASKTLKLSMGVIAGTESFEGHTVLQCTAPISPGNSGGPLLQVDDDQAPMGDAVDVVGVNFAAIPDHAAENVNYVVPALHIRQIIYRFRDVEKKRQEREAQKPPEERDMRARLRGEKGQQAQREVLENLLKQYRGDYNKVQEIVANSAPENEHVSIRLAPFGISEVPADEAIYAFGKCGDGVFIPTVEEKSAFAAADPPVEAMSFITEVNGVTLDNFGAGRVEGGYLKDPLPFTSMLQMQERVEESNFVKVCRNGESKEHKLSMDWQDSFETGVREVREPFFEQAAFDYEVFAEVTIMQMSINHIALLMHSIPSFDRWLTPEGIKEPKLLVTRVQPGGYAASVLARGMVLSTVNGKKVKTLEDYRQAFETDNNVWSLETERGVVYKVAFEELMRDQLERVQGGDKFLLTKAVYKWAQKMMAKQQATHPQAQIVMNTQGKDEFQDDRIEDDSNVSFMELKQTRVQHLTKAQTSSRLRAASSTHQGSHKAGTRKWQSLPLAELAAAAAMEPPLPGQASIETRFAWRSQEWHPDLPRQAAIPERSPWPWRPLKRRLPGQRQVRLLASEATSGASPMGLKESSDALLDDIRMQLESDAFI